MTTTSFPPRNPTAVIGIFPEDLQLRQCGSTRAIASEPRSEWHKICSGNAIIGRRPCHGTSSVRSLDLIMHPNTVQLLSVTMTASNGLRQSPENNCVFGFTEH